ncbi:MAG: hypothetical protein IJC18_03500, partial [Clostridia bacterium]|nr:hypothetical protein [Clostridia bacterium]
MAKTKRRGLVFGLTMILAVALILSVSAMGVFAAGTNVALDATVSTSYCSSWETLEAVNDGKCASTSYEADGTNYSHYGSWGNESSYETITYTWDSAVTIDSTGIWLWYDGTTSTSGGIKFPASYSYEYLNGSTWTAVPNASGMGIAEDVYNVTTFDAVTTTGLRVTLNKQATDSTGVGVTEWQVYAASAATTTKATTTTTKATTTTTQAASTVSGNAATSASVDTSYCSSWETLEAVNDGILASTSYEANSSTTPHFGSWGNESSYETITYTWDSAVTIGSTGIFFWTDNGGILMPASYSFQYLNNGNWVNVSNASGLAVSSDVMNVTSFTPVTTTGFRVTINKQTADSNGVGVTEWEVYTTGSAPVVTTTTTTTTKATTTTTTKATTTTTKTTTTTTKATTTTTKAPSKTNIAGSASVEGANCSSWET